MKIAFDFDGVFIPDFNRIPILEGLSEFYDMAHYAKPIFKPEGEWILLTGRNPLFKDKTEAYITRHFDNPPTTVFHDRIMTEEKPWVYKTKVLNANPEIRKYIESDPHTVKYITEHITTGCKAYIFADYINSTFKPQ